MSICKGEVYVKKKGYISYALITEGVSEEGYVIAKDITSRDMVHDFVPVQLSEKVDDFLMQYEKAKPEQIAVFLAELKEKQRVVAHKVNLLEGYTKSQTPVNVEGLDRATANLLELNAKAGEVQKRLAQDLENGITLTSSQKRTPGYTPIHTSEGVLETGSLDSMDILGHGD